MNKPTVWEFFAGIGLARIGLERANFEVSWSNDYEPAKRDMYEGNFGVAAGHEFLLGDIRDVHAEQLPGRAAIAWASSPCTDLSLAGTRAGLAGRESGTFWEFCRIIGERALHDRPGALVLENVTGLATSHSGDDIAAAVKAFNELGYSVDVLSIDARRFVPQSRPRLFLVGLRVPPVKQQESHEFRPDWLQHVLGNRELRLHRAPLPPAPPPLTHGFGVYVEEMRADDARWWEVERVEKFGVSLSVIQANRLANLVAAPEVSYRTAYRRTRNGVPVWEVRADDIAGCLRTARGGSSKQAVVVAGQGKLRIRWMTPLEYARLMGAGEYKIDGLRQGQALFGFGDAVVADVVEWLATNYLGPALRDEMRHKRSSQVRTFG